MDVMQTLLWRITDEKKKDLNSILCSLSLTVRLRLLCVAPSLLQSGDNSESTTWIHDPGSLCVNSSDRCCVINAGTLKPINHCLNNTVQQSSAAAWLYGHIYHLPAVITSMMFHVTKQKSSSHGLWTRLRVRPRQQQHLRIPLNDTGHGSVRWHGRRRRAS